MPTIAQAVKLKTLDANETRPALVIWKLQLDDGREAEIARKPDSPEPSGEVTVEETSYGLKAKMARQGLKGGGGGSGQKDPKGLRREAYGSALHAAIQLAEVRIHAESDAGAPTSDDIIAVANKFYEATMAKVGADITVGGSS